MNYNLLIILDLFILYNHDALIIAIYFIIKDKKRLIIINSISIYIDYKYYLSFILVEFIDFNLYRAYSLKIIALII